jgi:integrase
MAANEKRHLVKIGDIWYFRKKWKGNVLKRCLGTSSIAVARDLRDVYLNNLIQYNQLDPPVESDDSITFGQVAQIWAPIHKKEVKYSSWRDYVSKMNFYILPVFKDRPINDISYIEIVKFRNSLDVKAKSANNIMVPMKSVFDMAEREDLIQQNVMRKIKRLKEEEPEIHPFSCEQIEQILVAVDPWYKPYIQVAFSTGMRAGELNGLQWNDFQEHTVNGPQISIKRTYVYGQDGEPKTRKSKRIIDTFPEDVVEALKEQKKLTGNQTHIFLTKDGDRMNPDHFRNVVWTPALKKAGIEYRPAIQTRHTFATLMLSGGRDIGWVQNMLGHASLQMIFQRYYAWIPRKTRTGGKTFREFIGVSQNEEKADNFKQCEGNQDVEKRCTNVVPIDAYRKGTKKVGL